MKIQRLRQLKRKLASMSPVAKQHVRAELAVAAQQIVDTQRAAAPEKEGKLRRSIKYTFGDELGGKRSIRQIVSGTTSERSELSVVISAGDETTMVENSSGVQFQNARLQEFGAGDMSANPFFYPGYRLGKKRAKSRVTRAIRKAAKKVAQS